jgi:hypothetical protein
VAWGNPSLREGASYIMGKRPNRAPRSAPAVKHVDQVETCIRRFRYAVQLATIALASDPMEAAQYLRSAVKSVAELLKSLP